jgi:hypothetical protein
MRVPYRSGSLIAQLGADRELEAEIGLINRVKEARPHRTPGATVLRNGHLVE